jgi:hypothetical protein
VKDSTGNSRVLLAPEYKQQMPQNSTLLAVFTNATASMKQMYDTTTIRQWERTALQYDAGQMSKDKVTYVIAARKIPIQHLVVMDTLGGAFLHRVKHAR